MFINDYNSFNEGLLGDLSNKMGKIKTKFSLWSSSIKYPELKKYDISIKKISDKYCQFIHNKRVIAELRVQPEEYNKPVFKLSIYFYDSEIKNTDNSKLNQKFEGQEEQPYAKGSRKFFNTEDAIKFLSDFWSKKTQSGSNKNPQHKLNI